MGTPNVLALLISRRKTRPSHPTFTFEGISSLLSKHRQTSPKPPIKNKQTSARMPAEIDEILRGCEGAKAVLQNYLVRKPNSDTFAKSRSFVF
jgi:hypothetical protein